MNEEGAACWRKIHALRISSEERRAEFVFESPNLPAERRLRHMEFSRGAGNVAFVGHGHEIADLTETHRTVSVAEAHENDQIEKVLVARPRIAHDSGMPVELLNAYEIVKLRAACRAAAETLAVVGDTLRAGMSTLELDALVREDTRRRAGKPSQLGYKGFPAAVCTSRNHVVCHGIPSAKETLRDGDIVNVDVTTELNGFHGDTSATFCIGTVSADAAHLVQVARRALAAGIAVVRPDARLGDIGAAIEAVAAHAGCSVVADFGGHGIGRKMHMAPHVSHVGQRGTGLRLRAGMAFTIEPMINLGRAEVRVLRDGWTVVTADGSLSAQFEHTVLVTESGCEVLTQYALPGNDPVHNR